MTDESAEVQCAILGHDLSAYEMTRRPIPGEGGLYGFYYPCHRCNAWVRRTDITFDKDEHRVRDRIVNLDVQ